MIPPQYELLGVECWNVVQGFFHRCEGLLKMIPQRGIFINGIQTVHNNIQLRGSAGLFILKTFFLLKGAFKIKQQNILIYVTQKGKNLWLPKNQEVIKLNTEIFRFMIVYENCYQCCIIFEYWTVNTFHAGTV